MKPVANPRHVLRVKATVYSQSFTGSGIPLTGLWLTRTQLLSTVTAGVSAQDQRLNCMPAWSQLSVDCERFKSRARFATGQHVNSARHEACAVGASKTNRSSAVPHSLMRRQCGLALASHTKLCRHCIMLSSLYTSRAPSDQCLDLHLRFPRQGLRQLAGGRMPRRAACAAICTECKSQ